MTILNQEPAARSPTRDKMFAPLMMLFLGKTAYVKSRMGTLTMVAPMTRLRRTLG